MNIFKGLKISFLQKNPRRDSGLKFFPKIFDDQVLKITEATKFI